MGLFRMQWATKGEGIRTGFSEEEAAEWES